MRRLLSTRPAPPLLAILLVAGCIPAPRRIAPPPAPAPAPVPVAPAPVVLGPNWEDWPRTPGDWSLRRDNGRGSATFATSGTAALVLSCDGAGRMLVSRRGGGAGPLTIRTSSMTRVLPVTPQGAGGVQAVVAANDPLLDAIAFSRGRFTVEQAGTPPLVLAPYAEIDRAIEDCRG